MATRDVPQIDELDLPDIPDDDDVDDDDDDDLSIDQPGAESKSPDGHGRSLPPFIVALLARAEPMLAPVAKAVAPLQPILAKASPYVRAVPSFAWVAIGVAAAVIVLGSVAASAFRPVVTPPTPVLTPISAMAAAPLPTRQPSPTYTPAGPTATATPVIFEPREGGWSVTGPPRPNPLSLLPPGKILLVEGGGDVFTFVTRASVGLRAGPAAPIFGVILSHRGEGDHLRVEFYTDSYQRDRPFVGLVETKAGTQKLIGPNSSIPELDFWGRDSHEIRLQVIKDQIQMWVDAQPIPPWKIAGGVPPGKRGLYVWGGSRMHFDALSIS